MAKAGRGGQEPRGTLTPLQKRFAEEYLKDFNAKEAARRAGYKGERKIKDACHMVRLPAVAKEIDRLKAKTWTHTTSEQPPRDLRDVRQQTDPIPRSGTGQQQRPVAGSARARGKTAELQRGRCK